MIDPTSASLVKAALAALTAYLKRKPRVAEEPPPNLEARLSQTVRDALGWAATFQVVGMAPARTEAKTVSLRLTDIPRRFRSKQQAKSRATIEEKSLLADHRSILLLGDPGCGKTTTLKRITYQFITGEAETERENAIPIVLRFRELGQRASVVEELANRLGLPARWEAFLRKADDKQPDGNLWIGKELARDVLSEFFGEYRAVIILDGLDEYAGDHKTLVHELNWLQRNSGLSQLIISSRSGADHESLEGFFPLEICPLSEEQVDFIAGSFDVEADRFRNALAVVPYADLVDRPLYLVQLLLIFKNSGELPEYRVDTYRLIVDLMLKTWDQDRAIRRRSRYSKFSSERKAQFLSALAYYLTFEQQTLAFDARQFRELYLRVRRRFDLPEDEDKEVAREIESHTGLVVLNGYDRYEFSHASIHEFLAADYISRNVGTFSASSYINVAPETAALTVTLVSDPSAFIAALFSQNPDVPPENTAAFVHRLLLERAVFDPSVLLGVTLFKVFACLHWRHPSTAKILRILDFSAARESIWLAGKSYEATMDESRVTLVLVRGDDADRCITEELPGNSPTSIELDKSVWRALSQSIDKVRKQKTPKVSKRTRVSARRGLTPRSS